MSVANYFLGSFKDGKFRDVETMRQKSTNGKLILIHEDATTRVYDDVNYIEVPALYAEACSNEGMYIIRESGGEDERDRYFECETSDSALNDTKVICAYDIDDDAVEAVSYLDVDENDIYMTSETIGKEAALAILHEAIDGNEDILRVDR